jgi:hypothetical protein
MIIKSKKKITIIFIKKTEYEEDSENKRRATEKRLRENRVQ